MGIVEKKMETTIMGCIGFRNVVAVQVVGNYVILGSEYVGP